MTKNQVEIGGIYVVKVSGTLTEVKITSVSIYGGWNGINTKTGREVRIRTAGRLRRRAVLGTTEPATIEPAAAEPKNVVGGWY